MQQLTNNNLNQVLSENDKIKQAFESKKVGQCTEIEVDIELSTAIDKAILFLGLNTHDQDRYAIKAMACEDVRSRFPLLAIKEVSTAIELGVRGKYGDVIGIAPKDVYNWINAYSISNERRENQERLQKELAEKNEPTEEEKEKVRWDNLINAWELFKQNGYFKDFGNSIYNYLDKKGKIKYSVEQKEDFKRMAIINLKNEYNPLQHIGNFVKVSEVKSILNEIETDDKNARIIAEAKKVALNYFFKELAEMEMEITDLFLNE